MPKKADKGILHQTFDKAREAVNQGENDTARNLFDFMILLVAQERLEGADENYKMEEVKIGVWLERAWYGLENNNLLLV
tara:strand:+ start:222 stop:458 length:237 start_codon:yes stop_codon:yes gene_type:complete